MNGTDPSVPRALTRLIELIAIRAHSCNYTNNQQTTAGST